MGLFQISIGRSQRKSGGFEIKIFSFEPEGVRYKGEGFRPEPRMGKPILKEPDSFVPDKGDPRQVIEQFENWNNELDVYNGESRKTFTAHQIEQSKYKPETAVEFY